MKNPKKLSTLYKIVLKIILKGKHYPFFICNMIYRLHREYKISKKEHDLLLSHFKSQYTIACEKFNAKGKRICWWEMEDVENRIKFLEYLIKETKKQKI